MGALTAEEGLLPGHCRRCIRRLVLKGLKEAGVRQNLWLRKGKKREGSLFSFYCAFSPEWLQLVQPNWNGFLLNGITKHEYDILLIHLPVGEYFGSFHFLVIMSNAAIDICIQVFVRTCFLLGGYLEVELLGHIIDVYIFKKLPNCLPKCCTVLHSNQQAPISSLSHQYLSCSFQPFWWVCESMALLNLHFSDNQES